LVVTTSNDHTAQIWEIRTGKKIAPPLTHLGGAYTACFTPSGKHVVTGARDGSARIWSVQDGSLAAPLMSIGRGLVRAVVSPCGRLVATAGGQGARLWDARSGRLLASQMDHDDWVTQVRFSHDSSKLVSAGEDGTARIWQIPRPDDHSVEELQQLAHLISGHQADSVDGLRPLEPARLQTLLRSEE
jgi:WD40 repeat protein